MTRVAFYLLFVLAVGALLGVLTGWPFGFAGGWRWWAATGVCAGVAVIAWFLWSLNRGANIIAGALACILLVALGSPQPARADSEARKGADFVRMSALPCKDEAVVAAIQALGLDPLDFRAARAEFGGQTFLACWRRVGDLAHIVYQDGDQGAVPFTELKPLREA